MPPRSRPSDAQLAFDALSVEGVLISPAWLARVAQLQAKGQTEADYRIQKGLNLRDEIGRYWRIAQGLWSDCAGARAAGADPLATANQFVPALMREVFGFTSLASVPPVVLGERIYPIGHQALGGRTPVVVAPAGLGLDRAVPDFGDDGRRRSAFGLLQEYLNATDATLWGLACDGATMRIARDNGSLTRPAWIEADLERIFTEERYADFTALWLLAHETRFGHADRPPTDCLLETWRTAGREEGTRARDHLRDGVEEALRIFGQGFLSHPDNHALRAALQAGDLTRHAYFQQLLRLVYRLIFLLTVEEREVLHPQGASEEAKALYAGGYSVRLLRDAAVKRSAHDRFSDRWEALKITWRGLATGQPVLALPALGGLFAEEQCPSLDSARLENRSLLAALFRLSWLREATGLSRVNWRDMGPEELGSVYESLLELEPQVTQGARQFGFATGAETRGNARKLTGSYYTPDALVQMLLDSALEPVIEATVAANPGQVAEGLLSLSIIDPACGSGHFLLAAARRLAAHVARHSVDGTPSAADYRQALRRVVGRCIFGVDRNPMALELARTALWLEAMTPEAPLTFVDHHLVCGDALLGLMDLNVPATGIPQQAFKDLAGDDPAVVKRLAATNKDGLKAAAKQGGQMLILGYEPHLAEQRRALDAMPDGTLEAIEAKRRAQHEIDAASLDSGTFPVALAADYYMAAFLAQKRLDSELLIPTTTDVRLGAIAGLSHRPGVQEFVRQVVRETQVLHWPLAFAQVFARGGFDVVLGNPPWEKIELSEQEFFANRDPAIATAPTQFERGKLIDALAEAPKGSLERRLYAEFLAARHLTRATVAFAHNGGRYPLTGVGKINTYPLFAETALQLLSPRGRAGMVVPSGIATDDTTKDFFAHISDGRLVQLLDFENREGIFPGVHRSTKFCLLTMGHATEADFAFFLGNTEHAQDARRHFQLSPADISLLNPNTRNCPTFRSSKDAELAKKIYRHVPILWNETRPDGNPWGLTVTTRLFNMAEDSKHFKTETQLLAAGARRDGTDWVTQEGARFVRLYEAKLFHHFDHRWATYDHGAAQNVRELSSDEKANPNVLITPRYWVPYQEVEARLAARGWSKNWHLGWRGIARSTDERTVIASFMPRVGVSDSCTVAFPDDALPAALAATLVANLSSLVLDFAARFKVGGSNLNLYLAKQLPVLPPDRYDEDAISFISERVAELILTSEDMRPAAEALGHPLYSFVPARRAVIRAELDAYYVALYGLTHDDLCYILDPAEVMGPDHPSETFRVLKDKEMRLYGEYRTRRLVLEAWDRLQHEGKLPVALLSAR